MPPLVLVTGANGFIAARTVEALLNAGYSVRGTVRSPTAATALLEALPQAAASGTLTTVLVPDITAAGAFDEAVKGVVAVAHIASPVEADNTDVDYVLGVAVRGTVGILESALSEPGIRSFVYMSSVVALRGHGPKWFGRVVDERDWNDEAENIIAQGGKAASGMAVYAASKVKAEQAFWQFRDDRRAEIKFAMSAVNPAWVAGPPLILPNDPARLSVTAGVVYRVMAGENVPSPGPGNGDHVDVRDVARLVVFTVAHPDVVDGQRYVAGGNGNYANIQAHCDLLRRAYPERRDIIPEGTPGKGYFPDYHEPLEERRIDGSKAVTATGRGWIPFEETVLDAAKAYERYFSGTQTIM